MDSVNKFSETKNRICAKNRVHWKFRMLSLGYNLRKSLIIKGTINFVSESKKLYTISFSGFLEIYHKPIKVSSPFINNNSIPI